MKIDRQTGSTSRLANSADDAFLSRLFRPSTAYSKPSEVLDDEDLTLYEKRAIIASWASDAWEVDSTPALRKPSSIQQQPASMDEIMRCLRVLDLEMHKRCAWHNESKGS